MSIARAELMAACQAMILCRCVTRHEFAVAYRFSASGGHWRIYARVLFILLSIPYVITRRATPPYWLLSANYYAERADSL